MRRFLSLATAALATISAANASYARQTKANRTVSFNVSRDNWFSNVGAEADGNNGGAPRLKIKSNQEMSLIDFDVSSLKGKIVSKATLYVLPVGEPKPKRVTVGTFGSPWFEGTASGYAPLVGASTHNHKQHPDVLWAGPGSDLCSVILGQGGTTWRMDEGKPAPGKPGWLAIKVEPIIVGARVAGVSEGFFLFDDTGSEWKREGEKWTPMPFPNRFLYSRDERPDRAPVLTCEIAGSDESPPAAPGNLAGDPAVLPAGEAWVSWTTPEDNGKAGTIGYFVKVDGKDVPSYLIPLAGQVGLKVRMHLRDLNLEPGKDATITVSAVDSAGNIGPASSTKVKLSALELMPLPNPKTAPISAPSGWPKLGSAELAVVDELDKIHPKSLETIPAQPESYFVSNHLWSARDKTIRLAAAKNEFVGFQIVVKGDSKGLRPTLAFEGAGAKAITTSVSRFENVLTQKGPLPDPLVELESPALSADVKAMSFYGEIYVPHNATPGVHRGSLKLANGSGSLEFKVELEVWDFTLPDALSFLPEMNCYGLPDNEKDYYRLAHAHRTVLNRVPYHHSGEVSEGFAPKGKGKTFDWSAWDKRFGPYFTGAAFSDLPRKGVPIECFYLPLFENWPTPIEPNYNGSYWADLAFKKGYREGFVKASAEFAKHMNARAWTNTFFQFYLNGKNDFKQRGWSRGTCPWLLDEPAHLQDFWALRFFGQAFHEGVDPNRGKAKLVFRCDISRPQWQRDTLDGLLDYNVVGGAMRQYTRIVMDRKEKEGQVVVEYGSANAVEDSNVQPVGWSIDSWSLGSDGVLPWQTIGTDESWTKADQLSLFYPPRGNANRAPLPSIRLKAFRRGQQDVEYLTLYAKATAQPRWAVGESVRSQLKLAGSRQGTGFSGGEDAGVVSFANLKPQDAWKLRMGVGQALSKAKPKPASSIRDWTLPVREKYTPNPGMAR